MSTDPTIDAALEAAADDPERLAELLDDVGADLLLQSHLASPTAATDRHWSAIRRDLSRERASPHHLQVRRHSRPYHRTILTVVAVAAVAHVLIVGWWALDWNRSTPIPGQRLVDERWQDIGLVDADRPIESGSTALRLLPAGGERLTLAPGGILRHLDDHWHLQAGSLAVDADEPVTVRAGSSTVAGAGRWRLERGRHRLRLAVTAGNPTMQHPAESRRTTTAGEVWDLPAGAPPRRLNTALAARLPLTLAERLSGADLLAQLDAEAGDVRGITPDHPLHMPFMAPPAWDLDLQIRRRSGDEVLALVLPHGGSSLALMLDGWAGTRSGFKLVGGDHDLPNPTAVRPSGPLLGERWSHLALRLRPGLVAVYLDDELLTWLHEGDAVPPLDDLIWPPAGDAGELRLMAHENRFELRQLRCQVHPDGVGQQVDMYGPQLP